MIMVPEHDTASPHPHHPLLGAHYSHELALGKDAEMRVQLLRAPGRGVRVHPLAELDDAGDIARLGMTYPDVWTALSHRQITSAMGGLTARGTRWVSQPSRHRAPSLAVGERNRWRASLGAKCSRHSRQGAPPGQEEFCPRASLTWAAGHCQLIALNLSGFVAA